MRRILPLLPLLPLLALAACDGSSLSAVPVCAGPVPLTAAEVETILAQGAARALLDGNACMLTVVNRDGVVVGAFEMAGAPAGLEASCRSKARTAAFLSSNQHAFNTRTALFIIGDHFPPDIDNTPGGPLYGVQFSSLSCSDVVGEGAGTISMTGNGLSGDFGSVPLYRDGCLLGAVAADGMGPGEGEERAAWAASAGFRPAPSIWGSNIFIDGVRLPFVEEMPADLGPPAPLASFSGTVIVPPAAAPPDLAFPTGVFGGLTCEIRYPVVSSPSGAATKLLAADVTAMLDAAAALSDRLRAGIRRPLGSAARMFIAVVDADGVVLGCIRTPEATLFSFDVAIQKARTAAFFSSAAAAFSTRALGFLAQGFYPPGIQVNGAPPGPLLGLQEAMSASCGPSGVGLDNGITVFPGGIPLYKGGVLVGGIGVSGDGVDQDDYAASAGAALFPPPAGIRSDEIDEALAVAELRARVGEIAAASADATIDAAAALADSRLATGLSGIRLPWVRFPRSPFR